MFIIYRNDYNDNSSGYICEVFKHIITIIGRIEQSFRMFVRFLYHKLCSFMLPHLLGIYMYVFKKSKIV